MPLKPTDSGTDIFTEELRRRERRRTLFGFRPIDITLSVMGLAIATVSGALPFYVHRHPDQFSPPRMHFSGMPAVVPGETEDRAPRFKEVASGPARTELDAVITSTPQRPDSPLGKPNRAGPDQNFPGDAPSLSVLHAIPGRAIVVDGGVINIVKQDSVLSDGSRIVAIRFNGKEWEVETSTGQVVTWQPGAS